MKKLTSICLSVVMLISTLSANIFAAEDKAFTDVKGTEYYATEASALTELDILEGYEDGSFGANKNITRAEMAAIVCRMINKEDLANKSKGTTPFDDVIDSHWASGYINVAADEKIINGDGNGKFRPEDSVSYEEAIKMVVCSLNMANDVVVDKDDWSKGYIEIANKKGITDNLKGKKGESATRGDIAVMSYNGLTCNIVKPEISLESGTYTGSKTVKLTSSTEGSEIYYTVDGTQPTIKSTKYTKAITISKNCTLKAITVVNNVLVSDEAVAEYTIKRSSGGGGGGGGGSSRPTTYSLSFGTIENGTVNVTVAGKYSANVVIDLVATPADGYLFEKWEATAGTFEDVTSASTKFTMPAGNTEIVALFTQEEKVSDEVETLFGTDPDKNDTDEDGLSDYVEIYITHTNPLIVDTDENGINDANEDLDGDLLSNIEEVELGTLLNKKDSDSDDLTDYDEIENHKTLPLNEDTDGDGLTDGDEVKLELNPLLDKTDGITLDSNRQIEQEIDQTNIDAELLSIDNQAVPTLVATTSGNINNSIEIKKTDSVEFSDSRALIGEPIDICGEDFTDGQLTFSLDNQVEMLLLDDSDVEYNTYLICHYKNDGTTSFLKTDYDKENNTISAGIDATGTYFVTDVKALFDELGLSLPKVADLSLLVDKDIELMDVETDDQNSNENIDDSNGELFTTEETIDFENVEVADANAEKITLMAANGAMAQADIIFIIDTTGSMSGEINNVKNNVGYFVDALKEKGISAGLALVEYRDIEEDGYDTTKVHKNGTSNWFYDMDAYKNKIASSLYASGGGDTPESVVDALETARLLDMRASAGKIFILVTDANYKTGNRYGIPSMAAEIELLKNAGVNCSVVTGSGNKSTYYDLYNETDGIYVNINGNFYNELMTIADKIGDEIVGDGYWIYLEGPIPVPVRLDAIPEEGSIVDTDDDGIYDIDELESITPTGEIDLDKIIEIMSDGAITGTDYGKVMMYEYKSNPAERDTDFDGVEDSVDEMPKSNTYSKSMKNKEITTSITYTMDFRNLFADNSKYNSELAVTSSVLSSVVYHDISIDSKNAEGILKSFGFEDDKVYNYTISSSDNHLSEAVYGTKTIQYEGKTRQIVPIVVRGTNGTIAEWSSNFDIGTTEEYTGLDDWKIKENHKGFDIAATRIINDIKKNITISSGGDVETVFWITGHSRGAAIANIIGARLSDEGYETYTYTFAAPNTTTVSESVAKSYDGIFNIVNDDDFVPCLPMADWSFRRYGKTSSGMSIETSYEKEWEKLTDIWDYNNDRFGMQDTIDTLADIVKQRDECYKYTCECHGDGTHDDEYYYVHNSGIVYPNYIKITNLGMSEKSREEAIGKIPDNASPFCKITRHDGWGIAGWDFDVCQTPEYFMQVLAARMAFGNDFNYRFVVELNIAPRYENAKLAIVGSALGGLEHPHYQETYYLLSTHVSEKDFK